MTSFTVLKETANDIMTSFTVLKEATDDKSETVLLIQSLKEHTGAWLYGKLIYLCTSVLVCLTAMHIQTTEALTHINSI
jgi:hypothetical protein